MAYRFERMARFLDCAPRMSLKREATMKGLVSRRALPPFEMAPSLCVSAKLDPIRKTRGDSLEIFATASSK
jgi:hypothetical protein